MLDVQDFDQHKDSKMNFLFNDGSAAAKNNIIVHKTSEYLKVK
jgi:prepilin-type processing-associated H-X9-DG protein